MHSQGKQNVNEADRWQTADVLGSSDGGHTSSDVQVTG